MAYKFEWYLFATREKIAGEWFPSIWIAHHSELTAHVDIAESHYEQIIIAAFDDYQDAVTAAGALYPNTSIRSAK